MYSLLFGVRVNGCIVPQQCFTCLQCLFEQLFSLKRDTTFEIKQLWQELKGSFVFTFSKRQGCHKGLAARHFPWLLLYSSEATFINKQGNATNTTVFFFPGYFFHFPGTLKNSDSPEKT